VFRAVLPGQSDGTVEFLPVLRFAGQPISPRLEESVEYPRYRVGSGAVPIEAADSSATPSTKLASEPRWDWNSTFLWTGAVGIRKEVVGALPDGLRINWHVTEGRFVGPRIEGVVLPGATDWMRIRPDGIGIVNVNACLQTSTGALVYWSYGGMFDLGADGYARALRGEFDPLPAFVVAPTYTTADQELAWLNRAQCIGVGRMDMKALRAEYDIYAPRPHMTQRFDNSPEISARRPAAQWRGEAQEPAAWMPVSGQHDGLPPPLAGGSCWTLRHSGFAKRFPHDAPMLFRLKALLARMHRPVRARKPISAISEMPARRRHPTLPLNSQDFGTSRRLRMEPY
jgi:hypothetical protein